MAKRLGEHPNRFVWSGPPPNGPVWTGPAVEDPKLEQSHVMDTRSIRRLEYARMVYFWTVTRYGACPKNETCAFSEGLTHHCTGAGGAGYEKILDWPPWKEPLPTRAWLTTP